MKLQEIEYAKEGGVVKSYKVLILKEDASSMEGISIKDLSLEDQNKVVAIYKTFEEQLNPYMKNYRKFLKARIVGASNSTLGSK